MLKHNQDGKIEKWSGEVIPTDHDEVEALKLFASRTAQQRAEIVLLGEMALKREWQLAADEVTG